MRSRIKMVGYFGENLFKSSGAVDLWIALQKTKYH
jgi:hypothetical protein